MHKAVNDADADLISALERVGYNVGGKGGPGFLYKEWDNNGVRLRPLFPKNVC